MRSIFAPLIVITFAGAMLYAHVTVNAVMKPVDAPWVTTAYCKGTHVAAGFPVKRGMAASDPTVIPLGSIVRLSNTGDPKWDGVYTVVDTGPEIQGRELDVYSWSCFDALDFGRRQTKVEILRKGWMPNGLVTR